jgi:hypothetical protein
MTDNDTDNRVVASIADRLLTIVQEHCEKKPFCSCSLATNVAMYANSLRSFAALRSAEQPKDCTYPPCQALPPGQHECSKGSDTHIKDDRPGTWIEAHCYVGTSHRFHAYIRSGDSTPMYCNEHLTRTEQAADDAKAVFPYPNFVCETHNIANREDEMASHINNPQCEVVICWPDWVPHA